MDTDAVMNVVADVCVSYPRTLHEGVWGSAVTAPFILNLGPRRMSVCSIPGRGKILPTAHLTSYSVGIEGKAAGA